MDVYPFVHLRFGNVAVSFCNLKRKLVVTVLAVIAVVIGVVVYSAYDPSVSHYFPKCVFKSLTGYDCPGCGSQRAIHSLLHGDVASAFGFNAMLVCSIPFLLLLGFAEFFPKKVPRLRSALTSTVTGIVVLVLIVAWWIVRNIIHV